MTGGLRTIKTNDCPSGCSNTKMKVKEISAGGDIRIWKFSQTADGNIN